jgi:hypothetical protein
MDAFFKYFLFNKCLTIKKILNNLIMLIWIDFESFVEKIKFKNFKRPSVSIETFSERDILRIFSVYFVISNIWLYIFLLMMLIS